MAASDGARARARDLLTVLTTVLPVPFPVRLRWKKMEGFGESEVITGKDGQRSAIIDLRIGLDPDLCCEVVCHEFSHILAWDYLGRNHDAVWGIAYAEVYKYVSGDH